MSELRQLVNRKLSDPSLQAALRKALDTVRRESAAALGELADLDAARDTAGAIRHEGVNLLRENLALFAQRLEAAGTTVLWAETAADARRLVSDIVLEHKALRVIMSKTMVGEEIELEQAVRGAGANVIQTDLGERVVQLAHEKPSHITAPCLHMSAADIGGLLHRTSGMEFTDDATEISRWLAGSLRPVFLDGQLGITGANFVVAETGAIVSVENEGNLRMGYTVPPVHVVVTGIEKVVREMDQVQVLLSLLARKATGQRVPCYVSLLAPAPLPGQKRYVVLVDNGRTDLFNAGPFRELLKCIRCGACMNVCPVYEMVGGHAYRWTYPGPIGIALAPVMAPPGVGKHLPDLCTLCGACTQTCPVKIPLDRLIVLARSRAIGLKSVRETRPQRRALQGLALATKGVFAYRLSHWGHQLAARWFPARLAKLEAKMGWHGDRKSPEPAQSLFRAWFKKRKRETGIGE